LGKGVSFDGWLLTEAQNRGARVVEGFVSHIHMGERPAIEVEGKRITYDLVVLTTGVNSRKIKISGLNYKPPQTRLMAMNEIYVGAKEVKKYLGDAAHAFVIPYSGLLFGTLVPKEDFINVSVLASGNYPVSIEDFLNYDIVKEILPKNYTFACGCRPRATVSPARNFIGDRFITVGDAAITRLYKDGIGSALMTGRLAAHTVVYFGTGKRDFEKHYLPFLRHMKKNNLWGKLLFYANDHAKDSPLFVRAQQRLIAKEQEKKIMNRPFTRAAWGMFTGIYPYGEIAKKILHPLALLELSFSLLQEVLGNFLGNPSQVPVRRLYIGERNILILGGGFGGVSVLKHLARRTNRNEKVKITLISEENYLLFTPLLHEAAMGSIETRHIAYPIRRLHWQDRFQFILARVEGVDFENQEVKTAAGIFSYDSLVIALGSVVDKSTINLVGGKVFTLKTLYDAMALRNHIISNFERVASERDRQNRAPLLTFVIVGGGYIGVQAAAELADFIHKSLLLFYRQINPAEIRIVLVENQGKIVSRLDEKLGAYVMKELLNMGIEVRTRSHPTNVGKGYIELDGKETIRTETIIWTTGMRSHPLLSTWPIETDELGRIYVNNFLEVRGLDRVYALGDCARFENPKTLEPIPPRAHTTVRQAKVVAHNILADLRGLDKKAYRYSDTGEIVSLGASKAVFRFYSLRLYGFTARLIWLLAYSTLITGSYNRIRIVTDWLLSLIFGRDLTLLDLKKLTKRTAKTSEFDL